MPIRICKASELTSHASGRKSVLDTMAEWVELKTKLSNGLKPFEAIEVELPANTRLKALRQSFKNRVDAYLKKLNLTDYEVVSYVAGGHDYVSIWHVPVIQFPKAA
jgi:hypothetical protein